MTAGGALSRNIRALVGRAGAGILSFWSAVLGWWAKMLAPLRDAPAVAGIARHLEVAKESFAIERERAKTAKRMAETAFLPAALEVLETPPNPIGRSILWIMMGFLVIALAWACLGKVDEVAIASGKIIPRGEVKLIQAADYGVVRAIHVVDGQLVKKGQPLIELDPTVSGAETAQAKRSLLVARTDQVRALALAGYDDPGRKAFATPEGVDPETAQTQQRLQDQRARRGTRRPRTGNLPAQKRTRHGPGGGGETRGAVAARRISVRGRSRPFG